MQGGYGCRGYKDVDANSISLVLQTLLKPKQSLETEVVKFFFFFFFPSPSMSYNHLFLCVSSVIWWTLSRYNRENKRV